MKTIIFILFVALFGQQSFASEQLHNHNHSNESQMESIAVSYTHLTLPTIAGV